MGIQMSLLSSWPKNLFHSAKKILLSLFFKPQNNNFPKFHCSPNQTLLISLHTKKDNSDQKLVLLAGDHNHSQAIELETPMELKNLIVNDITSSKGLVLISEPLSLWNPATGDFKFLPEPLPEYGEDRPEYDPTFGLGFDDIVDDDHKVFRVTYDLESPMCSLNFQALTKKVNAWRRLPRMRGFMHVGGAGVSVRGHVYFLAMEVDLPRHKLAVMSFECGTEEVRKVTAGPDYRSFSRGRRFKSRHEHRLVKWKEDSLAVISADMAEEIDHRIFFSVIKKKESENNGNGNDLGFYWTKLFAFDYCYAGIRGVWSDGRVMITRWRERRAELVVWDPWEDWDRERCLVLAKLESDWHFGDSVHYVPSLVSVR